MEVVLSKEVRGVERRIIEVAETSAQIAYPVRAMFVFKFHIIHKLF